MSTLTEFFYCLYYFVRVGPHFIIYLPVYRSRQSADAEEVAYCDFDG